MSRNVWRRRCERAVEAIEAQQRLDGPSYSLEHGLALGFTLLRSGSRPVQDLLHGTWLGHPLHPPLTDVPLGAWTTAVVLDGLNLASPRDKPYADGARIAVGLGVLGGLGAALTGLTDWQHTQDAARRSGLIHGALNVVALGLNTLSWRDRQRGRLARARAATAAGYALALASSYLGGRLVFTHRVGVTHTDSATQPSDQSVPGEFQAVLAESELHHGVPRLVTCEAVNVLLVRRADSVFALGAHCPHAGAPLAQGWVYRTSLVCPWHGSMFDLTTGAVRRGPAVAPLPCYETRIRDGQIEVRPKTPPPAGTAT